MKKLVVGVAVVGLISVGVWFTALAQQTEPQNEGGAPMQMGPKMMQHMMEGMANTPMMAQCMNMCRTVISHDSPSSLVALNEQLGLTEEQVKKLIAIEEQARNQAKVVLTDEQRAKFEELTKDWKPQSMMQGMQNMMPQMQKLMGGEMPSCPMMQMMRNQK